MGTDTVGDSGAGMLPSGHGRAEPAHGPGAGFRQVGHHAGWHGPSQDPGHEQQLEVQKVPHQTERQGQLSGW